MPSIVHGTLHGWGQVLYDRPHLCGWQLQRLPIEEVLPMNEWRGSIKIGQDPLRRSSPHGHVSDTIADFVL